VSGPISDAQARPAAERGCYRHQRPFPGGPGSISGRPMFRRRSADLIRHRDSDGPDPKGYVGDQEYYALPAAAFDGN
jgi:hypothetical protein